MTGLPTRHDDPDLSDDELAAFDRLLEQGDAADLPEFRSWWNSDEPVTFREWLAGVREDIRTREAA